MIKKYMGMLKNMLLNLMVDDRVFIVKRKQMKAIEINI